MWDERPFTDADAISMEPVEPMPHLVTTEWFEDLPDDAIVVIARRVRPAAGSAPLVVGEIRHAGGAVARAAATAANDRARSGEFLLELIAAVPDPQVALAVESALRVTRQELAPFVTGAACLNLVSGPERAARAYAAFGAGNRRRLAGIKAAVDPSRRFSRGDIV